MSKIMIDRAVVEHDWQAQAQHTAQGWMDRALKAESQFERARRWAIAAGVPPEKLDVAPEAPESAKPAEQEPCGWQFFADGRWYNGSDRHDHRKHTEDAGFPTRDVYPAPQPAKPAEQEPVGYRQRLPSGEYAYCKTAQFFDNPEPIYTAPQPARWEGLTLKEVDHLLDTLGMIGPYGFARAIIAAYERKNGITKE